MGVAVFDPVCDAFIQVYQDWMNEIRSGTRGRDVIEPFGAFWLWARPSENGRGVSPTNPKADFLRSCAAALARSSTITELTIRESRFNYREWANQVYRVQWSDWFSDLSTARAQAKIEVDRLEKLIITGRDLKVEVAR
jgi:hypothetical protein